MRPDQFCYTNMAFEDWVREKPCLVYKCPNKATVHHVYNAGGKKARNSYCSVPLCDEHHLHGFPYSYHTLNKQAFEDHHSINLEWEMINLLSEWIELHSE